MSLSGSVESFPLKAVLSLLESTAARGVLCLTTPDGSSELHVDGGSLVGWRPHGGSDAADVLAGLMAAPEATFVWERHTPDAGHPPVALSEMVRQAEARLDEWAEMRAIVPSVDHRVCLSVPADQPSVTVELADWTIICAVGDGRPLRDVLDRVGVPALSLYRSVGALVGSGLLRIEEPAPPAAPVSDYAAALVQAEFAPPSAYPAEVPAGEFGGDDAAKVGAELASSGFDQYPTDDPQRPLYEPAAPGPAAHDEALTDRGPWPSEDLRSLVEQAQRESEPYGEAAPTDAADTHPLYGRDALASASAEADAAPTDTADAGRSIERGALLRFFSASRA